MLELLDTQTRSGTHAPEDVNYALDGDKTLLLAGKNEGRTVHDNSVIAALKPEIAELMGRAASEHAMVEVLSIGSTVENKASTVKTERYVGGKALQHSRCVCGIDRSCVGGE